MHAASLLASAAILGGVAPASARAQGDPDAQAAQAAKARAEDFFDVRARGDLVSAWLFYVPAVREGARELDLEAKHVLEVEEFFAQECDLAFETKLRKAAQKRAEARRPPRMSVGPASVEGASATLSARPLGKDGSPGDPLTVTLRRVGHEWCIVPPADDASRFARADTIADAAEGYAEALAVLAVDVREKRVKSIEDAQKKRADARAAAIDKAAPEVRAWVEALLP